MSRTLDVRRSVAATAALVVAAVGATALPAAAEPGNGNGQSQSNKDKKDKGEKKDKGDKGPKAPKGDKGPKGPQGPKEDKGPKGPKDDKGPKGPQGPKDDKGPKGPKSPGDGNGDPAGNNGTVTITPIGQDDGIPQNNPHVPCGFDIEWYGFDEGDDIISKVTLAMHAPTKDVGLTLGGPSEVFVGGDPATGAGTDTGFDGEATYYPTFDGEPHPKQGYHVKLTVNTPGSQGADTKHKVFWVEPCEASTTPDTEEEGEETVTEEETDTEVLGEQETDDQDSSSTDEGTSDETEVLGETATAGDDTEVMGAQASAEASVPSAVDAGEEGNPVLDLVRSPLPLLVIGLGALLAGAAFASRRRSTNV